MRAVAGPFRRLPILILGGIMLSVDGLARRCEAREIRKPFCVVFSETECLCKGARRAIR
jgi:hypothetical protein